MDNLTKQEIQFCELILGGASIPEAGEAIGACRSNSYKIAQRESVREYLKAAREAVFDSTVTSVAGEVLNSFRRLCELRDDATAPAAVRAKAAEMVITRCLAAAETIDLKGQIDELKHQLLELTKNDDDN